jgi:hypothetical protein
MKNVAALKDEPYITTLDNYRAGIEFQLKRIKYDDNTSESYIDDWFQFVTKMTERENFGQPLTANNAWLSD